MQVGILGPLTVEIDGRGVPVAGARLRSLITRLALDAPRVVSADELVDDLWADSPPADRANALQSLVSRARRALGTGSIPQVGNGYRLAVERDDVDAHRFAALCREGAAALDRDPAAANSRLTEALALWRGQPLSDAADADYTLGPARRLTDLRVNAGADRISAAIALGESSAVLTEVQELAAAHPLSEKLIALQMKALAAAGRPAEALDTYQRARDYLAEMLGADPSAELQQLHLDLLRGNGDPHAAPAAPSATGAAPTPVTDNLPVALTGFVGRDTELARIDELLQQSRLVTVIGPGGVGKTRLVVEAAARRREQHPDGRWLVPLASVTDPAGIVPAFLDALGLRSAPSIDRPEGAGRDATERLVGALRSADALLLVDNCEHLIAEVADLIALIGQQCPRVHIVATSREPLGLVGEALYPVPPLAVPPTDSTVEQARQAPAVQLLAERAAAVRSGFTVTADNLPAVLEIVRRLDGLPLAIELAAARLRLLPAAEVATLLSDRFRLLSGGNRAALPRHRTLWAVVEWSWDLLDDTERRVAERLSVFAGSWTVGAAAAVCADLGLDEAAIRDTLLSLSDKSLLDMTFQDSAGRVSFRMLETIKEFALVRCTENGGLDAARRAHAAHYDHLTRRLAPKLRTDGQPQALADLLAAHADIVDAIRFLTDSGETIRARTMAGRLTWFWIITDRGFEVIETLGTLAAAEPVDAPVALVLSAFCLMADMAVGVPIDDLDLRRKRGRELAQRMTGVGPLTGSAGMFEVLLYYFSGDLSTAMTLANRLVSEAAGPWLRGTAQLMFAMFAENTGDLDEVRRRLDLAWRELDHHPDRWAKAALINLRGRMRLLDGDLPGAIADAESALAVSISLGARDDELQTRLHLSQLYAGQGRFDLAHQQIDLLEELFVRSSSSLMASLGSWQVAVPVGRLAVVELQGDAAAAAPIREQLEETLTTTARPDGHLAAVGWGVVAMSWARSGEQGKADRALRIGHPIAVATEDRPVIASFGECVAVVAAAAGRAEATAELLGASALLRGGQNAADPILVPAFAFAREALGDKQFDAAYRRGREMSMDRAFARIDPATLTAV